MITREQLAQFCPRPTKAGKAGDAARATWDGYVDALTSEQGHALLEDFSLFGGPLRWPAFAATFGHECGGMTIIRENMSYNATRIVEVFGAGIHSARVTSAEANKLAGNAYALAERVYGIADPKCCRNVRACTRRSGEQRVPICKARELGNNTAGDGYQFRGCGPGQNTGRTRAEKDAAAIGCSLEDLETPINGVHAMLLEWRDSKCNELADREQFEALCIKWNGGRNGLEDRNARYAKAKKIWPKPAPMVALFQVTESGEAAPLVLELGDFDLPGASEGPVHEAQRQLTAAKFYTGEVDGNFASLMKRAVAAFQAAHGLPGTGAIDGDTRAVLEEISRRPPASVPGREAIDASDLLERGSRMLAALARVALAGWALVYAGAGWLVDKALNIGAIDLALDQVDKAKRTATKLSGLFGIVDANAVTGLVILLAGAALLAWVAKGRAAAVETAQKGDKPA